MRKLCFLVMSVISFVSQAQIVNIPDANFKAKLLSASISNTVAKNLSGSYFKIDANNDGEIQESEALNVSFLNTNNTVGISSLEGILYFLNLQDLRCYGNSLTALNINSLTNLTYLECGANPITSLNVQGLINLETLYCDNIHVNTLNVQGLVNLKNLWCRNSWIYNLNVSGCTNMLKILCKGNFISTLDLTDLSNLQTLECEENHLTSLITANCISLAKVYCYLNQLTILDLKDCKNLNELDCHSNQLNWLNIKNGRNQFPLNFNYNPNLNYICCDENQTTSIINKLNSYGYSCSVNHYCFFNPGGEYYTVQGNIKYDYNNNGCDISDINIPNLKIQFSNNSYTENYIADNSGNYSIDLLADIYSITPVLENPTYFNISPTSFVANFPIQTSPLIQDFCVTPNGVHHDVEVTIVPTNSARPGFDATYTIIYKNKGNQIENGAITLDFNDDVLDLVSANPTFSSQATNSLVWNYTNLQPFEIRTIDLVLNLNSPIEIPAVNIGDQLNFVATITPLTTDEFQYDNTSALKQIVVGSFDPNDKTCMEGTTVGSDMIGQYVHYVIRFENTGTYPAENVVVKDMIDLTKFDVATLIPLHSSHDFVTRINNDKVEFIFEGINLPFDDATNDGYIAFKIKTKPNLVVGNTFSNNANIYFDYNFPITTNTFTTTIAALKVTDFDFGTHFTLYPNPLKDVLNFQSKDNLRINSIEIYNTLGQIVLAVPNAISTVDVSSLQSGNYFVKVNTDIGVSNTKFIKE